MNLSQWLEYLEQCHPSTIELGLDRIKQVADKLPISFDRSKVITVAGTNGKGSTVTMLASILGEAGFSTCCYTSPHLIHYNERVKLGDRLATDEELCDSFAAVEAMRDDVQLTYFEFGTLAAFQIFSSYQPDYIILEIGLGGRLDAVNIVDPDLAILTNVALDHMDWLGDTREKIGFEKAGIFRAGKPALIGEKDIPQTVLDQAATIGAIVFANGQQFNAEPDTQSLPEKPATWSWQGKDDKGESRFLQALPQNDFPLDNCAAVVQAISLLEPTIDAGQIASGLLHASLPGRFQQVNRGYPLILDVAHNPHAAKRLASQIALRFPEQQVHLVLAMLADKNYREVVDIFQVLKPNWYVAGIEEERGLNGKTLYNYLHESGTSEVNCYSSISEAFNAAESAVIAGVKANGKAQSKEGLMENSNNGVVLVTGSFFTVTAVLELI